jgi:tetratricopeptide (TPR) repeat protein
MNDPRLFDELGVSTLIATLKKHPLALVGAGSSCAAGYPTWTQLLDLLAKEVEAQRPELKAQIDEARTIADLGARASVFRLQLGQELYHSFLRKTFGPENSRIVSLSRVIINLPLRHVLTTNYDAVLETAHEQERGLRPPHLVLSNKPYMSEFIGQLANTAYGRRYVHLHGRFDDPSSIVLTEDDYQELYINTAGTTERYFAMLATSPVVCIGFSLEDADVMGGFRRIASILGKTKQHVAILPSPIGMSMDAARALCRSKFGIEAVFYERTPEHGQLLRLLEYVSTQYDVPVLGLTAPQASSALISRLERDLLTAETALEKEEYSTASALLTSFIIEIDDLLSESPADLELQRFAARAYLRQASVLLVFADHEGATKALSRVSSRVLAAPDRLRYARNAIRTGDLDSAQAVADAALSADVDVVALRQFLTLKRGTIPSVSGPDWLLLEIATTHLTAGLLFAAATCAKMALTITTRHLVRAAIFQIYSAALLASAQPELEQTPIPAGERLDITLAAEMLASGLEQLVLPPALMASLRTSLLQFYVASFDMEGVDRVARLMRDAGQELPPEDVAFQEALAMASSGRVADGILRLDVDAPEWWKRLQSIQLFRAAGDFASATEEIARLASDCPGVSMVEREAAHLLMSKGDVEGALLHAQRAVQIMPGRGQRLTLAQALLADKRVTEANELLNTLPKTGSPAVLRARALVQDVLSPSQAIPLWREYLQFEKTDVNVRVHLASILFSVGHMREAAEEAWEAASPQGGSLPPRVLFECALLQTTASFPPDVLRERLSALATSLRGLGNVDPEAHGLFMQLFFGLDAPQDLPSPDMTVLESLGLVRAVSIEEAAKHVLVLHKNNEMLWNAYRNGVLSFVYLCKLTNMPASVVVSSAARSHTPLSAPAWQSGSGKVDLADLEILIGHLELLVLSRVGLLQKMEESFVRGGRLLIFHDVKQGIAEEVIQVNSRYHPFTHQRYKRLWAILSSALNVAISKNGDDEDDSKWAAGQMLRLVSGDASADNIAPAAVAAWMADEGIVPMDLTRKYLARTGTITPQPVNPGTKFAIDFGALVELDEAGLLEPLKSIPGIMIHLGPATTEFFLARVENLEMLRDAAEHATSIHEFLGRAVEHGWLIEVERPEVSLPDFKAADAPAQLREGVSDALTWRLALLDHPKRRLLSCDFLVNGLFTAATPLQVIGAFAWTQVSYRALVERVRGVDDQVLPLPAILPGLVSDPGEYRYRLAELGFASALQWQDIVTLARRYGSLSKSSPERVLEGFERIARDRSHPAARMSMLEVARRYAHCLWGAFSEDWSDVDRNAFTTSILDRLILLDAVPVGRAIETALRFFASIAASDPRAAFVPSEDKSLMMLSSDQSSAGKAWKMIFAWASGDDGRMMALERGLQDALLLLDKLGPPDGPTEPQFAPLMLGLTMLRSPGRVFSLARSGLSAVSILSSRWVFRPLTVFQFAVDDGHGLTATMPLEEMLSVATASVEKSLDAVRKDNESWIASITMPGGQVVDVALPPEAVLLRLPAEAVPMAANALAAEQGIHDGEASTLLRRLAEAPSDDETRDAVARRAASAPWRAIRSDPTVMLLWGMAEVGTLTVNDSEQLLTLLSEPPFLEAKSIHDALFDRVQAGGLWETRKDQGELVEECLLSSWPLALNIPAGRAANSAAEDVAADAASRLANAQNFSHTMMGVDVVSLMLASVRASGSRPEILTQAGDILEKVLEAACSSPTKGSFAFVESSVMQLCSDAVIRVCGPTITMKDYIWRSRRLFQWYYRQLQFADRAATGRALDLFAKREGSDGGGGNSLDILDPRNAVRSTYDLRLAIVLYSLNVGLRPELYLSPEFKGFREGGGALSEPSLSMLANLVSRDLTSFERQVRRINEGSAIEAWPGPKAIPDMAVMVLSEVDEKWLRRLDTDARRRWLEELAPPAVAGSVGPPDIVSIRVMIAVAQSFDILDNNELQLVKLRVGADVEWPTEWEPMRLWLATCLYDRGQAEMEELMEDLLQKTMDTLATQKIIGVIYKTAAMGGSSQFLDKLLALSFERLGSDAKIAALESLEEILSIGNADARTAVAGAIVQYAQFMEKDQRIDRLVAAAQSTS